MPSLFDFGVKSAFISHVKLKSINYLIWPRLVKNRYHINQMQRDL